MNKDLKLIKKHYGEKMMHLCRELFPTLLEDEGYLSKLMLDNFASTKFLYEDIIGSGNIEGFKNYIYSLVNVEKGNEIKVHKHPQELLAEAGYDFYECKTEKDIQFFKKYYRSDEELCTFNGGRLNSCHVFFAIKKNVDEIERKNFKKPQRQDEYGTSVISIQFSRGINNTLSIKNRYNHTVNNPDATFSNNLENIIEGLTESFEREYNLNINQASLTDLGLQNYVKANDGKFYKYNYEINNIYYCPNNIIIDNFIVNQYPKERYIILDYFILDLKEKTITTYLIDETFHRSLKNIQKINIVKDEKTENKIIEIFQDNEIKAIIKINKLNQIIEYENYDLTEIKSDFLFFNNTMIKVNLPKIEKIGDYFLNDNENLEKIYAPKLETVGDFFLHYNFKLTSIDLPNLKQTGRCFLEQNKILSNIITPNLEKVGSDFLNHNELIKKLDLPKLEVVNGAFLHHNKILNSLNLPKLRYIGKYFLYNNNKLKELCLENVEYIGDYFLYKNEILNKVELPKVKEIKSSFLRNNKKLKKIELLQLLNTFDNFISENKIIEEVNLPKLKQVGPFFLSNNRKLKKLILNEITWISHSFLEKNEIIEYIYAPNLNFISFHFLSNSPSVKLYAPLISKCSSHENVVFVNKEQDLYENKIVSTKIINNKQLQKCKNQKSGKQKVK